jgi:predicted nucleotidyltransferase
MAIGEAEALGGRCGMLAPEPTMEDIAKHLRDVLRQSPPAGVVSVYLFGSHAAARAHRESDLDVGVLLRWAEHPTPRDRFEQRLRLSAWLGTELRRATVDLVILNDAPPGLAVRIVTRGLRVYCADDAVDHAFVRDAQLRAADIAPFLRRTRRIKLEALGRR